jgi:hypothetical protein
MEECMVEIDLRSVGDTIVLHLHKQHNSINAYLFASTLVALADAAKEANEQINPGYEIEVLVEALADGSFRAIIHAIYHQIGNLFSKQNLQAIILALISSYIYEKTLAPDKSVRVIVQSDEVVIQQEDTKIIVPRQIYDAEKMVRTSTRFTEKIGEAFDAILKDSEITSVSLDPDVFTEKQYLPITREAMERIAVPPKDDDEDQVIEEIAHLQIIRAILEKSRRRWEFSWKGFRIPAPILDDKFYNDFISHRIVIAPGDRLEARLRISQHRDPSTGVYMNDNYEVIEVLKHESSKKQIQNGL